MYKYYNKSFLFLLERWRIDEVQECIQWVG